MTKNLFAAFLLAAACGPIIAQPAAEQKDFSQAEKLLFMTRQLDNVALPGTLRYAFRQTGSAEAAFDDKVRLDVSALDKGKQCCKASGEFLSGSRKLELPPIDGAEGNPVVLYFLENDIRTMQRLTKGSQTYFRKRIRMALFNSAEVRKVQVAYKGKDIEAQEILISPYLDDPNRAKFEQYLGKQYRFILAPAVPGGVYGIQTTVGGAQPGTVPLIQQEMLIDGAPGFASKPSS